MKTIKKVLASTLILAAISSPLAVYFLSGGQDVEEIKQILSAMTVSFTTGGAGIGALYLVATKNLSKVNNEFMASKNVLDIQNKEIAKLIEIQTKNNQDQLIKLDEINKNNLEEIAKLKEEIQVTNEKIKNGILKVIEEVEV